MNVVLHLGLPRTGTTFLQEHVFKKMDINFISKHNPNVVMGNFIVGCFLSDDKVNVISDEILSGDTNKNNIQCSRETVLLRLKKLFPDARVIVTFRDKKEWVDSIYRHFIGERVRTTFVDGFDDWYNNFFNISLLDFDGYKDLIMNNFDDFLFLDYEELIKDDKGYVKKISDFIGVDVPVYDYVFVNKSMNDRQLKFIKFCSKIRGNFLFVDNMNKIFKRL